MRILRLFGVDIVVDEDCIKLFGNWISPHAALNNNNNQQQQQHNNTCTNMTHDFPPSYMWAAIRLAGGSRLIYIGRKKVENSDVNQNLSRFFIPTTYYAKLLEDLSTTEIEKIENEDNDKGLRVSVMDPQCNFHGMNFTRWKSLRRLVFNRGWNNLVVANQLQKGDTIDLWHFRTGTPSFQSCFAINIIKN